MTTISLTVAQPQTPDFSLAANPTSLTVNRGASGTSTIAITRTGGFTGSGYVNFPALGVLLEFRNVDGGAGGNRTLRIRYSLGASGSRTGALVINGAARNITFNSTLSWTTWATQDVTVALAAGSTNTIQLQSNGQDLANIDLIEIR